MDLNGIAVPVAEQPLRTSFLKYPARLPSKLPPARLGLTHSRGFPRSARPQHSTAQHSTAQHSTAQHSTARRGSLCRRAALMWHVLSLACVGVHLEAAAAAAPRPPTATARHCTSTLQYQNSVFFGPRSLRAFAVCPVCDSVSDPLPPPPYRGQSILPIVHV
jgi:hypothetical protein